MESHVNTPNRLRRRSLQLLAAALLLAGCGEVDGSADATPGKDAIRATTTSPSPLPLVDPKCGRDGTPAVAAADLDASGPFALPSRPDWLRPDLYCGFMSIAAQSPSKNRLEVEVPGGVGYVNLAQGSIYPASLVPVFSADADRLLGYFNPTIGFVETDRRTTSTGPDVFKAAGAGEAMDALREACGRDEPKPTDPIVCDTVTKALFQANASPGIQDFVDPVK